MVVPALRISQSRRRISPDSVSVSPLQISSQSRRVGRAARARANSSRFKSPTESKNAGRRRRRRDSHHVQEFLCFFYGTRRFHLSPESQPHFHILVNSHSPERFRN